jgi:hypothetical protein
MAEAQNTWNNMDKIELTSRKFTSLSVDYNASISIMGRTSICKVNQEVEYLNNTITIPSRLLYDMTLRSDKVHILLEGI